MWYKHFDLWRRSVIQALVNRAEIGLWLVLDSIPILVLCVAWAEIFRTQTEIRGFSFSQIINYYLLVNLINHLSASHFEQWRVQQIREGKIDFFLTRPLSYLWEIWWRHLGGKTFYIMMSVIFFFALRAVVGTWWQLDPLQLPALGWLAFFACVTAAFLIEYLMGLYIVLLGFWFEGSEGLEHFKWISITILSGSLVPVSFMPQWLQTLTNWLPFKYMYAWPIGIIQGTHQLTWFDVSYLVAVLAAAWFGSLGVWHFAKKQYTSAA